MPKEKLKKIKDLSLLEIMKIHNTTPCSDCPLKDEEGNCIRSGTHYNFSDEFLNREIVVEDSLEVEEQELSKEFVEKGWDITPVGSLVNLRRLNLKTKLYDVIHIDCAKKTFYSIDNIDMETFQLLHKLFSFLGWI